MNPWIGRLVAGVVALGCGTGAAFVLDKPPPTTAQTLTGVDVVDTAVTEIGKDHVYVAPEMRSAMSPRAERRVEAAIAESGMPLYVVVWQDTWAAGYDHYIQAAEAIVAQLPEPSGLILWSNEPSSGHMAETEGYSWESSEEYVEDVEFLGDPAPRLLGWVKTYGGHARLESYEDGGETPVALTVAGGVALGAAVGAAGYVGLGLIRRATGRPFRNRPPEP